MILWPGKVGFRAKNHEETKKLEHLEVSISDDCVFEFFYFCGFWVFWHMVTSKNHNHSQEVTNLKPFGAVNQC